MGQIGQIGRIGRMEGIGGRRGARGRVWLEAVGASGAALRAPRRPMHRMGRWHGHPTADAPHGPMAWAPDGRGTAWADGTGTRRPMHRMGRWHGHPDGRCTAWADGMGTRRPMHRMGRWHGHPDGRCTAWAAGMGTKRPMRSARHPDAPDARPPPPAVPFWRRRKDLGRGNGTAAGPAAVRTQERCAPCIGGERPQDLRPFERKRAEVLRSRQGGRSNFVGRRAGSLRMTCRA